MENEEPKSSSTIKMTEGCLYFWPEWNEQPNSVPASEQKKEGTLVSGPGGAEGMLPCPSWDVSMVTSGRVSTLVGSMYGSRKAQRWPSLGKILRTVRYKQRD